MERLTMREDRTHVSVFGDDGIYSASDLPHIREAINLLADYEDTGLTPKDFAAAGQMEHFKEWRKWHKADAEKRLVVLPCKVGDTVYRPLYGKIWEGIVLSFCFDETVSANIQNVTGGAIVFERKEDFGKTVFLAREDAEAALAKEGGNDGE